MLPLTKWAANCASTTGWLRRHAIGTKVWGQQSSRYAMAVASQQTLLAGAPGSASRRTYAEPLTLALYSNNVR